MERVGEYSLCLTLYKQPARRVGRAYFHFFQSGLRLFSKRFLSVPNAVLIDLVLELLLILLTLFLHQFLDVFILIGVCFYMRRIDKQDVRFHETMLYGFFKNSSEDGFENVAILEAPHVVFSERRKVRNRLREVIAEEPPIGQVRFNFPDRLPHRTDSEELLNEHDLDEDHGVDAGTPRLRTVFILYKFVYETKVNCIFDFTYQMILRYKLVQ